MILHVDKKRFLDECHALIDKLGKDNTELIILGRDCIIGKLYEDDVIYISANEDKSLLEVQRKSVDSPIIFVEKGEPILFSGDYIFLVDHVQSLLNT